MRKPVRWRHVAVAAAYLAAVYALGYTCARLRHLLVRYESGCVMRTGLHRDLWVWQFRCGELRRYMPTNGWELMFAPLVAAEELSIAPPQPRPSVCSLPAEPPGIPSQGFPVFRPWWCPGALPIRFED